MSDPLGVRIRTVIKHTVQILGVDISRSTLRRTMKGVLAHLKTVGVAPATVIDVGVGPGTPELYRAFPRALHLLVEPLEEFLPVLRDIVARHNAQYRLVAASDRAGTATVQIRPSALETTAFGHWPGVHSGITREVPTVRLDALWNELRLQGPAILKIDVQGSELVALEGARGLLPDTEVIILEVSLYEFHAGLPQFADLIAAMRAFGFVVYDLFGGYYRPLDGALGQIDLVFVREIGGLRRDHRWQASA